MSPHVLTKGLALLVVSASWLSMLGCANAAVVANSTTRSGRVFGTAGIKGSGNSFTVERGSRIHHFSIWGDNNNVLVEDGAWIQKVEIFGVNNTVSVPDFLPINYREVGKGNRVERRPPDWSLPAVDATDADDSTMTIQPVPSTPTPGVVTPAPRPTPPPASGPPNYTAPPTTP